MCRITAWTRFADQTISMLLALIRKVAFFRQTGKGRCVGFFERDSDPPDQGKNMGLIGLRKDRPGVARRVSGFGVKVIAFDPYLAKAPAGIELKDFDRSLKESDMISVHCPLNQATRHLVGEREFRKMEKKPIIINTSRGPIVDEEALNRALEQDLVSGAGLDVLEKEPPGAEHPLLNKSMSFSLLMSVFIRWSRSRAEAQDGKECSRCPDGNVAGVSGQR